MSDPLLILGASARAAVGSAIRAGLSPFAADLFCDDDLRRTSGGARRVRDYPAEFPQLSRGFPPGAWMFTGALENHPGILDAISVERVLWGTPSGSTRRVRDPWELMRRLDECALCYPPVLRIDQRDVLVKHVGRRWIHKPFRSAGGGNIKIWSAGGADFARREPTSSPRPSNSDYYLQQFIDGQSQSAVFVAARGAAVLLGVTRQLIGTSWTGATGFRYAGSIGPLPQTAEHIAEWGRIGSCLAGGFGLQGLFGVDAIVNDQGIWTIEVNPRYTSSIEVLEFALELHALDEHVAACRDGRLHDRPIVSGGRFRGKAVIYASRDVWIEEVFVEAARHANAEHHWPVIADIPTASQTIAEGHPVATVFASSVRLEDVEPRLRDTVHAWRTKWLL